MKINEVISNSDSRNDRCGSIYDISKMAVEPIFCHKVSTKPNSTDGVMTVSLSLNSTTAGVRHGASNSALLVVCLYDEVVKLDYDNGGNVIFTDLIS